MSCNVKYALVIALFIHLPVARALDSDRDQPVQVTADSASYNQKSGVAIYIGNVVVIQGSMHLWADQLQVQTDANGKIDTAHATGNPARYEQIQDPQKGPVTAHALIIDYDVKQDEITLTHNAHIHQDDSTADGSVIHYRIQDQHIDAIGDNKDRVFLVFPPSENKTGKDKATPTAPATTAPATTAPATTAPAGATPPASAPSNEKPGVHG